MTTSPDNKSDNKPVDAASGIPRNAESPELNEPHARRQGGPSRVTMIVLISVVLGVMAVAATDRFGSSNDSDSPEALAAGDGELAEYLTLDFTTSDGTNNLAAYTGEPLVVNFFASWCAPCRREMPEFEQVFLKNDIAFLGISHDLDESSWLSFVEQSGVTFETVFQPQQEIYIELEAIGMPTTVFLNSAGQELDRHTGPMTADQLQDKLDELYS